MFCRQFHSLFHLPQSQIPFQWRFLPQCDSARAFNLKYFCGKAFNGKLVNLFCTNLKFWLAMVFINICLRRQLQRWLDRTRFHPVNVLVYLEFLREGNNFWKGLAENTIDVQNKFWVRPNPRKTLTPLTLSTVTVFGSTLIVPTNKTIMIQVIWKWSISFIVDVNKKILFKLGTYG